MFNSKLQYVFTVLFLMLLIGCSNSDSTSRVAQIQQWMNPNGKVKVFSTIAMIDDLVKQVGGEHIDTSVLILGDLDPHSYQLVKGDDEKLAFADVIFYNGLGLEHGPSLQSYLLKNKKAIALGDKIIEEDSSNAIYEKGQLDPHIWMDISLWAKTVPYIVEALSQKDPANAEIFKANGQLLITKMMEAHAAVKKQMHSLPSNKRYFVTSHDAFNYFARAYLAEDGEPENVWQERFVSPEGLAPESQISTTDIQAIIDHLTKYHIHVLFPESNVNRDSIRKIVQAAKENGMDVKIANVALYADAMGKQGSDGDSYLKMLEHNAKTLSTLLEYNGKKE